jgi:hypothetical protein
MDGHTAPGHHTLYLPLNPDIQFTRAIRTTATQTIEGAWVDNFGLGIGTLTLSSHTGWASGLGAYNGQPINGFQAWQMLWYNIMEYYFALQSQQATQTPHVTMQFASDVDELFCTVMPTSTPNPWTMIKNKTKPYLFQYTLSLIVLRDNNHPGAVSPIADPIDPLIQVHPGQAVSHTVINLASLGRSPVARALPLRMLYHKVTAHDTLKSIATSYVTHPDFPRVVAAEQAIQRVNGIATATNIYPGQLLAIPQPLP